MTAPVGQVPGSLIDWAAGVIGVSSSVVAAQIREESGGNPNAVSPTGAQGVAQFEPGTWRGEGCGGSPFNVNDAMKCYAKYMYQLVRQEHGNVRDALAAYNAGPGNLQAGYGYADAILAAAGQPSNVTAKGGTGQAGTGGSSSSSGASNASKDPTCAWGFSGSIVVTSLNICMVKKTTIRHIVGGMLLLSGGSVMLVGAALLAASAFQRTGALSKAADAAAVVPGGGAVAEGLTVAHRRASRTGAGAASERRGARVTAQRQAARQQRTAETATRRQQRREDAEARRAAGSPASQSRARRGLAPRQAKPASEAKPRPPREVHH